MTVIRFRVPVAESSTPDFHHLHNLTDGAADVIEWAMRLALADDGLRGDVAWHLDLAIHRLEDACKVSRAAIAAVQTGRNAA